MKAIDIYKLGVPRYQGKKYRRYLATKTYEIRHQNTKFAIAHKILASILKKAADSHQAFIVWGGSLNIRVCHAKAI